eukprot:1425818-Amphidinium_carterae.1
MSTKPLVGINRRCFVALTQARPQPQDGFKRTHPLQLHRNADVESVFLWGPSWQSAFAHVYAQLDFISFAL